MPRGCLQSNIRVPGCTSRSRLETHHIWMESHRGPDDGWNRVAVCAGHHVLIHTGVIELGGWAPWELCVRMGVDPRTGRALICYRNGRVAPEPEVKQRLAHWRSWCRRRWDAARRNRRGGHGAG